MSDLSLPDRGNNSPGGSTGDTIEVELNPQDVLTPRASPTGTDPSGSTQARHLTSKGVGVAVVTVAAAIIAFASITHHQTTSVAPPPVVVQLPSVVAAQEPTPSTEPPVHFRNPFDRSETFDFPAGTTQAEARQAVADLLLQRASERRPALRVGNHRSGHQPTGENLVSSSSGQ